MRSSVSKWPRALQKVASAFSRAPIVGKKLQATLDFRRACLLLELNELRQEIVDDSEAMRLISTLQNKFEKQDLTDLVLFANDRMTTQLSEMFQHMYDIEAGDIPIPTKLPELSPGETAADSVSIGPSTHTNPKVTLDMKIRTMLQDEETEALRSIRNALTQRYGFSLWLGPSQAPTTENTAGVYLKGFADVGQVVGLFPGAVYNSEMRQRASDFGHFGNPSVPRFIIPRYDDTIIDAHGATSELFNAYALAHHVRHPPKEISPNVMRVQYDFIDEDHNSQLALDFPKHLRPFIPNQWGSEVSIGQDLHGMLDQDIYMKGSVLVTTRQVMDEELFYDHQLNPFRQLPPWYESRSIDSDRRIWKQISA